MKTKSEYLWLFLLVLGGILLTLIPGCEKIAELVSKKEKPTVTTTPVTDITYYVVGQDQSEIPPGEYYRASSGGDVTDDGGIEDTFYGVVWSKYGYATIDFWEDEDGNPRFSVEGEGSYTVDGVGTGEFTSTVEFLEPETTYYLRAFAVNSEGAGYGEEEEFETQPSPDFTLTLVANPTAGGSVEGAGEYKYKENVSINADPSEGYMFENWTDEDGAVYTYNPYGDMEISIGEEQNTEFGMPGEDLTLTANFTEIPTYTLTLIANPEEGGTVEGAGEYEANEYVNINAVPNYGYEFVSWTDEDGHVLNTNTSYSPYMTEEDITITANFRKPDGTEGTVTDVEGNIYPTIYIGGVEWMTENLRTTKYANDTEIPGGLIQTEWEATTDGAYTVYPHDGVDGIISEEEMLEAYGALYNWYAVETGNLCPDGWRVPTHDDWTTLERYVGGTDDIFPYDNFTTGRLGGNESRVLKSCRQVNYVYGGDCSTDVHPRWDQSSYEGTDSYGFSALPAGLRHPTDDFGNSIGKAAVWWSSSAPTETVAWIRMMNHDEQGIVRDGSNKSYGFSVRCIKE